MAKTIKAIICPTCGSNKKTEIRPDYYICDSCKTEYYLDSDDINVIHTNKVPNPPIEEHKIKPGKIALIVGSVLLLFTFFLFSNILSSSSSNSSNPSRSMQAAELDDEETVLVANKNNELFFVTIGIERTGSYEDRKEKAVAYFDDSNGKNIKKQEIALSIPKNKASSPFDEKYFANGDCYIIFNEKVLFKVDTDLLEIREVKQDFFRAPQFANGIAKLEGHYLDDGFKVQTLDGKTFIFLPLIDKVFAADDYYAEGNKIPAQAVKTTQFDFNTFSSDGISLLAKYVQLKQVGYPADGIYFDIKRGKLEVRFQPPSYVSFEQFPADRSFFNGKVLGYNDELLIIIFSLDGSSSSSEQIQALDVKTGAIRWTFDTSTLNQRMKYTAFEAKSNKEVTLIKANNGGLVIDNKTGKLIASVEDR